MIRVYLRPGCRSTPISPTSFVTWCAGVVPKLWNETIEAHRRAVRDAILDTTAALLAEPATDRAIRHATIRHG